MAGDLFERYNRQTILQGWGFPAQECLQKARVLVLGAGGLGCPALQYLAAAGVGHIGIIDFDVIELSNLQRQTLYTTAEIGMKKADCAAERIIAINPEITVTSIPVRLTASNAIKLIRGYDVVLDGTDNFATRYMINDACVLLGIPLIYGAVYGYEGQVSVFNYAQDATSPVVNYRDLFPVPPDPEYVPSCNEAGVIGVLPGIIGTMQAAEALKVITGVGQVLSDSLLSYNLLTQTSYVISITPHPDRQMNCPVDVTAFERFNYDWFCHSADLSCEITADTLESLLVANDVVVIDIREAGEEPVATYLQTLKLPGSRFTPEALIDLKEKDIVIVCQTGKRSLKLCRVLRTKFPEWSIFSLSGGVLNWNLHQLSQGILK
jgi:adenylyltransferase/sulfurtransferase